MKIASESEAAALSKIRFSRIERRNKPAQRVAQIASRAYVAPAHAEAPVQRTDALARDQVLA